MKFIEVAFAIDKYPQLNSTWWAPYMLGLTLRLVELFFSYHQQIFDYLTIESNSQSKEYNHKIGSNIISLLKMCFIAWLKRVAENELEKRIQQIRDDVAEVRIDIKENESKINTLKYYVMPDSYQDLINRYTQRKENDF